MEIESKNLLRVDLAAEAMCFAMSLPDRRPDIEKALREALHEIKDGTAFDALKIMASAAESLGIRPKEIEVGSTSLSVFESGSLFCYLYGDGQDRHVRWLMVERIEGDKAATVTLVEPGPPLRRRVVNRQDLPKSKQALIFDVGEGITAPDAPLPGLMAFASEATPKYVEAFIWSLVLIIFAFATPLISTAVYNHVLPAGSAAFSSLASLMILGLFIAIFEFWFRIIRSYLLDQAGEHLDAKVSKQVFRRLLHMKMDSRPEASGHAVNQVRDLSAIRAACASGSVSLALDTPLAIGLISLSFFFGGYIGFVPLVGAALAALAAALPLKGYRATTRALAQAASKQSVLVIDTLTAQEEIKAFNQEERLLAPWQASVADHQRASRSSQRKSNLSQYGVAMIQGVASLASLGLGAVLVAEGKLDTGSLVALGMIVQRAIASSASVMSIMPRLIAAAEAWSAINATVKNVESRGDISFGRASSGEIRMTNISVSAAAAGSKMSILKDFSVVIPKGHRIAFTGQSGSGKTTLARVLLRFLDVDSGQVSIDGTPITRFDPSDLRRLIAYVPQSPVLLRGTLRETILATRLASDEQIKAIIEELGATSILLSEGSGGLDRQVGEKGDRLSGGGKKLAALARALLFPAPVLLLDEPCSGLDGPTELKVLEALAKRLNADRNLTLILMDHANRASVQYLVRERVVVGAKQAPVAAQAAEQKLGTATGTSNIAAPQKPSAEQPNTGIKNATVEAVQPQSGQHPIEPRIRHTPLAATPSPAKPPPPPPAAISSAPGPTVLPAGEPNNGTSKETGAAHGSPEITRSELAPSLGSVPAARLSVVQTAAAPPVDLLSDVKSASTASASQSPMAPAPLVPASVGSSPNSAGTTSSRMSTTPINSSTAVGMTTSSETVASAPSMVSASPTKTPSIPTSKMNPAEVGTVGATITPLSPLRPGIHLPDQKSPPQNGAGSTPSAERSDFTSYLASRASSGQGTDKPSEGEVLREEDF